MSRSVKINRKLAEADPIFGNRYITRLINKVMTRGKKTLAEKLVYKALEHIKEKGEDPIRVLETAIANVGPKMEVRPRRVGGASYQVPMEVRGDRRVALAIHWIVGYANSRSNKEYKTYDQKLAAELLDAAHEIGEAIKKRDIVHRTADANKAFAHFKW